jgi:hypothetical protein
MLRPARCTDERIATASSVRSAQHGDDQDDQSHAQDPCGEDEESMQKITENARSELGVMRSARQHALLVEDDAPLR